MDDRIITADLYFASTPAERHEALLARIAQRLSGTQALSVLDASNGAPVVAYVNHGRWVADCPDCNGAEFVSMGAPFMCSNCLNGGSGVYRPVTIPAQRDAIERRLLQRKRVETRNWRGETVAQLTDENRRHGIGA